MKQYPILLLDADETLFDFRRAEREALERSLTAHAFPFGEAVLEHYREINEALWRALERGETTKEQLQTERFAMLFRDFGFVADPKAFGEAYLDAVADGNFLLPDAETVCTALASECRLYLTTNGITRVQKRRLQASALAPLISAIFVSEEAGAAKPQKAYFDYVFEKIGLSDRSQVLIVGDSLSSDIAGGKNAGIDTCWFNPYGKTCPPHLCPTWTIRSLRELLV